MRIIMLEEYFKDIKNYILKYIKSSNIEMNKKAVRKFELDRQQLCMLGVITRKDGTLYNDTKKFSKIRICTNDEFYDNRFTYADDKEIVGKCDQTYLEPYFSTITFVLDNETRTIIEKILYHFSFGLYKPFKDKIDIKVNKMMALYNMDVAVMQFKTIWTAIYCKDISATSACKLFIKAFSNSSVSEDFDGIHLNIQSSDSIIYKSKHIVDSGEFVIDCNIEFDQPVKLVETKEPTPEELYRNMLLHK